MKCQNLCLIASVAMFASLFSACSDDGSSAEYVFDASVVCPEKNAWYVYGCTRWSSV